MGVRRASDGRVSVVIATRNRRPELLRTLGELGGLPERPPVVVVDNASSDGTADAVRARFPEVDVVVARPPRGPDARNLGVARTTTPYVAFADDDSWWAPGSLPCAADLFDAHPRLGLLAASVRIGAERRLDPMSGQMARSPLPDEGDMPGVPVLGFLACAAVVRRAAFDAVGGFHPFTRFGGEETLLAADLATAGWALAYADELVAFHHPSAVRDPKGRKASELWNRLLVAALRYPRRPALTVARQVVTDALASRCWPLAPLVARHAVTMLRQRAVAPATVLDRLALVGELARASGGP